MKMHFLITFMFFMGLFSFEMNRKHMLMMLLSFEFIILSLMFLMCIYFYFLNLSNEYFFLMLFLSFSVCESVLGFSLLVSSIHSHKGDYFDSFNLLWQNFNLAYHL